MPVLTRRNMLQLFGLAAAGYASSFYPQRVARADNSIPKRIIFFYTDHGTLKQANPDGSLKQIWAPNAPGAPDPLSMTAPWSTNQHTLGDLHTSLVPHLGQLLFLDGIDMISAWGAPQAPRRGRTPRAGAHPPRGHDPPP